MGSGGDFLGPVAPSPGHLDKLTGKGYVDPMARCQKCGLESQPGAAVCSHCGTSLSQHRAKLAGTMMGMPSPLAETPAKAQAPSSFADKTRGSAEKAASDAPQQASVRTPSPRRAGLGGTMIGMPSPLVPHQAGTPGPAAPPRAEELGRTMVGVGSPSDAASSPSGPQPSGGLGQTMVGLGTQNAFVEAPAQPASPGDVRASAQDSKSQKFGGTLLGIAQPGIAPLHGTAPLHSAAPPQAAPSAPPSITSAAASPRNTSSYPPRHSSTPRQRFPTTRSPWKTILLIGAAMIIAAGIGGLIAVFAPNPVTVVVRTFSIDEQGNDRLEVTCSGCNDGDVLMLGTAQATVKTGEAVLSPERPLSLGKNELSFRLKTPNGDIKDATPIILPVAFRVLTGWEGRSHVPPFAVVTVQAPSGTNVKILGKEVPVKDERAELQVPFDSETQGEARLVEPVSAEVPVEVTVDGKTRTAQAELKAGITPLSFISPSLHHKLGGKPVTVEGETTPGATVTVGNKTATADARGKFRVELTTPVEGQLQVTSTKGDLLLRRVTFALSKKRTSLSSPVTRFDQIEPGKDVLITGTVIESRVTEGTTRVLLEVETGCDAPPCLLRAVYGEPFAVRANRTVQVSGRALGGTPITVRTQSLQSGQP